MQLLERRAPERILGFCAREEVEVFLRMCLRWSRRRRSLVDARAVDHATAAGSRSRRDARASFSSAAVTSSSRHLVLFGPIFTGAGRRPSLDARQTVAGDQLVSSQSAATVSIRIGAMLPPLTHTATHRASRGGIVQPTAP